MLFVLITLWTIAAVMLVVDRKSGSARWLSAVAFCGGSGALAVVLGERIIPQAEADAAGRELLQLLHNLRAGASWTSYYFLPFSFLLFALHYSRPSFFERHAKTLPWLLVIPPLVSLLFTPEYSGDQPIRFRAVSSWALPYIGLGTVIVIRRKEWNRTARFIHWMACLAVLPPVLFSTAMNYVLPSLGLYKMWRYNTWIIAFGFIIFLVAIFNYGFMGIRIRIQKRQLDSALRAITSGTAILNHAIKNDVGKMKLFGEKVKLHARQTGQQELEADIGVILNAAEHIEQMIKRVHEQTKDFTLKTEPFDLGEALDQVIKGLEPRLAAEKIELVRVYRHTGPYNGDRAQLTEAMNNVITNAIEAMPEGGTLSVSLRETKKHLEVEIKDTGHGIASKDLPNVLEPFFTTKPDRRGNFGLGLAYTYHVAKKHDGSLDIMSAEGAGTTVLFRLPLKRVITKGKDSTDGSNQSVDRRG